jgi:ammonium transporter, Amt family
MTLNSFLKQMGLTLAAGALLAGPAFAAAPQPDKGDTTWMLVSTILVLLMTIPGLALFYGGLVRSKNMLSILTQVLATVCLVALIWVTYGYSMAFTSGGSLNDYVGGFSKMFLSGVDATTVAATFSNGVVIPELAYMAFQMTFACITPALIVGAALGHLRLFPDGAYGLVLGWPRCHRRRRKSAGGSLGRCRQSNGASQA